MTKDVTNEDQQRENKAEKLRQLLTQDFKSPKL